MGKLHLEIRSVKGESTLLPLILKLTVVALGFPSISFQKKSTSQFIKHPVETSNFDLQEISVEGWSGPAILLSRNILLVCTQRCPQLYTHRDPAIWQKSYWLFHVEGDAISRGGSTLLQSSSDSQLVLYWHRSPTHPGWHVHVLPSLTPWSPHTLLGFDILSSFSKCKISAHLVLCLSFLIFNFYMSYLFYLFCILISHYFQVCAGPGQDKKQVEKAKSKFTWSENLNLYFFPHSVAWRCRRM